MLFTSTVSSCSIFGIPFIAARILEGECLLATAAFTCMSRTAQYPRGSAQAGIGWWVALETTGPAFLSATVNA